MFLIRDWYHQKDYAHGLDGGEDFLKGLLQVRISGRGCDVDVGSHLVM